MRRRTFLKRSQVLREGYIKGLKHAQRIINEMLEGGNEKMAISQCINYLRDSGEINEYDKSALLDRLYELFLEEMTERYGYTEIEAERAWGKVESFAHSSLREI